MSWNITMDTILRSSMKGPSGLRSDTSTFNQFVAYHTNGWVQDLKPEI
jgi:hypothetical protein